jgi:predicted nucleic acid-binding protein
MLGQKCVTSALWYKHYSVKSSEEKLKRRKSELRRLIQLFRIRFAKTLTYWALRNQLVLKTC